jgi:hypothetical protein
MYIRTVVYLWMKLLVVLFRDIYLTFLHFTFNFAHLSENSNLKLYLKFFTAVLLNV